MLPELEGVVTRLVLEAWGYSLTAEDIVDYVCARCYATPSEVVIILDALYAEMRD
jgi:hypothetical protein